MTRFASRFFPLGRHSDVGAAGTPSNADFGNDAASKSVAEGDDDDADFAVKLSNSREKSPTIGMQSSK